MPKGLNLKGFGRRKSLANALESESERDSAAAPASPNFRVLERPDKTTGAHGGEKATGGRSVNSPLQTLRGKSVDNLALGSNKLAASTARSHRSGWPLNAARGSGGTTNSGSSCYYESSSASARHSSTSTLPSSLDQDHSPENEELFAHSRTTAATAGMYHPTPAHRDESPRPSSSFSMRAGRAFQFANKQGRAPSRDAAPPPIPPPPHTYGNTVDAPRSQSPRRERAMTTSSYASTAVPTKTDLTLSSPDFGSDDFGNMFDSLQQEPLPAPPPPGTFHRTESEPMFPPRTHSRNALTPSPKYFGRQDSSSPYSWDDAASSTDGLVSTTALSSPSFPDGPSRPTGGNGISHSLLGNSQVSGYSRVPERYASPGPDERASIESVTGLMASDAKGKESLHPGRQAQMNHEERWTRKVELRDQPQVPTLSTRASSNKMAATASQHRRASPTRSRAVSPQSSAEDTLGSNTTTPRAAQKLNGFSGDSMFESSRVSAPFQAPQPDQGHRRSESGGVKKMTKAQFQALKRQDCNSAETSEEEELSGEDYDVDDEMERAKNMANQRRKQEANMSVYRQQMKKVTGGGPAELPSYGASTTRPLAERASSAQSMMGGGIHFGGISGTPPEAAMRSHVAEDEDEDVPLGILQAHGFPSANRPPTRAGDSDVHQRRASVAGSVMNSGAGQGSLPPFARRLPQDPYFGAGLVNHSTRESLALNSSGGSVVGMPTTGLPGNMMPPQAQLLPGSGHPAGLVGVIAGEERARAARRNPNAAALMGGNMGNMPLPSNMSMPALPSVYNPSGMPLMPQMASGGPAGLMNGMMQMPQQAMVDPSQRQMQQFMQMQMQVMQNMMAMQQMQMGPPGAQTPSQVQLSQKQQQTGDYLGINFGGNDRTNSNASQQLPQNQALNYGRSMTMTSPPSGWGSAANPSGPRPNSAMPMTGGGSYAPSVRGLNISGGGPGNGYTPSIAPSERSNVGMPSRYRPVNQNGDHSRSHSMTSSLTLQAFTQQQTSPNLPGTPFKGSAPQAPQQTVRMVDKPKGAPRMASRVAEDDEEEGWADMKKKREDKKTSKWSFRKNKTSTNAGTDSGLRELYQNAN